MLKAKAKGKEKPKEKKEKLKERQVKQLPGQLTRVLCHLMMWKICSPTQKILDIHICMESY